MVKPTKDYDIWLSSPHMSDELIELNNIKEAFEDNWIAPYGPHIIEFEKEIVNYITTSDDKVYACALSSGTAAIHMALRSLGIGSGDFVICSSFTFSASANPIIYERGTPIFIDSSTEDWTMDIALLEEALKQYKGKVKAVIAVHIYGLPCRIDEILSLCNKYNVSLIEDAAESLGSYYKGKHTGLFGRIGVFSFNGNKIITTSSGGMLVSRSKVTVDKVKHWSTQARDNELHYQHSELGFNYRMSNILAGIGRGQLTVLNERVLKKREIFEYYEKHLGELEGITFMPVHDWQDSNYWLSCIVTNDKTDYLEIIAALDSARVQSRPLWKPMHLQPFFQEYPAYTNGVSEYLFNNGLCLPSDTKMSINDLEKVCRIIHSVWKK